MSFVRSFDGLVRNANKRFLLSFRSSKDRTTTKSSFERTDMVSFKFYASYEDGWSSSLVERAAFAMNDEVKTSAILIDKRTEMDLFTCDTVTK